jgi:lipoprotein-releasing system permease protein
VGASFEIDQVKAQLRKQLGPSFKVQDSDEQHVSLFKAIKVEKLFVFITFTLILLIASLNIFFSLSMLVIDKKKDISVLLAMGASQQMVRRTFLYVGAIVALVGAAVGLLMGVSLCWLQQRFGLVSMGMATSVVESYPVKMQVSDIVFTCVSIVFITLAVSIRPALNAGNLDLRENL